MEATQALAKIRQLAPGFEQFIRRAARQAHNEAEFERPVNNEIERLSQQLGVNLLFREQYTLATGRADAADQLRELTEEVLREIQASLEKLRG